MKASTSVQVTLGCCHRKQRISQCNSQTARDAAQGDECVWSHELDCIDTAPDERLASTLHRLG